MRSAHVCGAALALLSCSAAAPLAPPPFSFVAPAASAPNASSQGPSPGPPPASVVPPPLPAPPALISQGDIGSAGPLALLGASSSGAWVALCQGEPATASLVLGSGSGESIDELLAYDGSGRHVIVAQGGSVKLIDSTLGTRFDLGAAGADVRRTRQDYAAHRALSFDLAGRHLAYLRRQGTSSQIVVRQLEQGSERRFDVGTGEVYRLRLSPDARYVSFEVLREDTTRNGRLDWPVPEETAPRAECKRGLPRLRSYAYQGRGDAVTKAVVSLADGVVRDVPELVTPLGSRLLVRETDGSLRLDLAGKRSPFAPAACAGRVLLADAEREQALVTCALPKKASKREVWLFAGGYAKSLQAELYDTSTDREPVTGVRLAPLYPGSEASLVDLERRSVLPLATGSRVLQVEGSSALLWRGNELLRFDAETGKEQSLAQGVLKNPDLLRAGGAVLLTPYVVLGAEAPALLSPTPQPLALASSGHVLAGSPAPAQAASAEGAPAARAGAIYGPLHWLDARLPPPDGPPR